MTALITGASSGIGLELARVFADHKHDVVLVARSEGKLKTLAAELQGKGVRAQVIASDLSAPGAAKALVDRREGGDAERQRRIAVGWPIGSDRHIHRVIPLAGQRAERTT